MAHVFISYVRADADKIDRLALDLYRQGIDTWTDRDIRPGQRWKVTIRQAIRQGASFLARFSPEVLARDRTYMYEEITAAIELLRQTPADRTWFIPVRLDRCEVPELEIGAGVTLGDLQRVDLFPDWEAGVDTLASAIRVSLTREAGPPAPAHEPRLPPLRGEPAPGVLEAWRSVWSMLFQLKVAGEALLIRIGDDEIRRYTSFLDADDFEQLEAMLHGALTFRRGKADVRQVLGYSAIDGHAADALKHAIDSNVRVFEQFSQLLVDLRDRYAARTIAAPGHPVSRGDAPGQQKLATLDAAAARSKRRADIRRAAEALVRRGEVTLASECPRGHGTLRDWEGLPRCWECGWPWKDFDLRRES
jgi:hypothetical protein